MKSKLSKIHNVQAIRYAIVGLLSVAIDYLLLFLVFHLFTQKAILSVSIGFWGSTLFNYLMHRTYTYRKHNTPYKKSLLRYFILVIGSYLFTIILIDLFMDFGINIYIAKFLTLCLVFIYGFLIGKYYVFK